MYRDVHRRTVLIMASLSVSEARASLPSLLDRVEAGEEVTLTRHGKAVAVLVRPDVLRRRRNAAVFERAARLQEWVDEARQLPLPDLTTGGLAPGRADELVAQIRADRDARP